MASKSKWIISSEKTSGILKGIVYYQDVDKWSMNKDVAKTFTTKAKAQEVCDSLSSQCSIEKI